MTTNDAKQMTPNEVRKMTINDAKRLAQSEKMTTNDYQ
jgi:hypothetical protein